MAERAWRDKVGLIGRVLFGVNVLAYLCRLFVYKANFNVLVIWLEIGFVTSILAAVLSVIGTHKRFPIILVIASIVLAYLWFNGATWWVMVKWLQSLITKPAI
jgi:hypothetical protein